LSEKGRAITPFSQICGKVEIMYPKFLANVPVHRISEVQ
jgi:hypothetical protein